MGASHVAQCLPCPVDTSGADGEDSGVPLPMLCMGARTVGQDGSFQSTRVPMRFRVEKISLENSGTPL